ncbi:MAG TPA: hypothetical protein VHV10_11225 [Ktedonobacteraceae bacterium]|nr:hypothetical protein [Ktedonobacteraceae bacterium]
MNVLLSALLSSFDTQIALITSKKILKKCNPPWLRKYRRRVGAANFASARRKVKMMHFFKVLHFQKKGKEKEGSNKTILKLADTKTFSSGVVALSYKPA